jgi:hypothetical protein
MGKLHWAANKEIVRGHSNKTKKEAQVGECLCASDIIKTLPLDNPQPSVPDTASRLSDTRTVKIEDNE